MLSDPFEVNVGVKQGCVLAPLLFNIYLAAVTLLSYNLIHQDDGITYRYRLDGSFLNLRRLQASTKTRTDFISSLQYADDAAIASHSGDGLQRVLDATFDTFSRCGLVVNAAKTEVLCQSNRPVHDEFHVGTEELARVKHFTYLGSMVSNNCLLDTEIDSRIRHASAAFGRSLSRVFINRD